MSDYRNRIVSTLYCYFSTLPFDRKMLGENFHLLSEQISRLLSLESYKNFKQANPCVLDGSQKVTASEYLMYKLGLQNLDEPEKTSSDSSQLIRLFSFIEASLLCHMEIEKISSKNERGYKLRLTGALSDSVVPRDRYSAKSECRFTVAEFDAELKASSSLKKNGNSSGCKRDFKTI